MNLTGIWEGGMLSGLGSFGLILMLAFSRNPEGKDDGKRFMYLNGLAFCSGNYLHCNIVNVFFITVTRWALSTSSSRFFRNVNWTFD
jgi:hypothetical protein